MVNIGPTPPPIGDFQSGPSFPPGAFPPSSLLQGKQKGTSAMVLLRIYATLYGLITAIKSNDKSEFDRLYAGSGGSIQEPGGQTFECEGSLQHHVQKAFFPDSLIAKDYSSKHKSDNFKNLIPLLFGSDYNPVKGDGSPPGTGLFGKIFDPGAPPWNSFDMYADLYQAMGDMVPFLEFG